MFSIPNRHAVLLLTYIVCVVAISFVQNVVFLLVFLALLILLSIKSFIPLLKRTLYSIVFFNLTISLGYALMIWLQQSDAWDALIRLNVRVFLLTFMSFSLIYHVDFFKALSFSKNLTYLMVIIQSQISVFQRSKEQFQQALMSRSIEKPSLIDRYRMATATVVWLFDKAFFASKEIALALKSRGFFHD